MSLDQPGVGFFETVIKEGGRQEETATPVFIGFTEKGRLGTLDFIETLSGFAEAFGGPLAVTAGNESDHRFPVLYHAVRHYFDNGGRGCFVCPIGTYEELKGLTDASLIEKLEDSHLRTLLSGDYRIALVAVPDLALLDTLQPGDNGRVWSRAWRAVLELCESRRGLFGILDTPDRSDVVRQCAQFFAADVNSERRAWVAAYWPRLVTDYQQAAVRSARPVLPLAPARAVLAVAELAVEPNGQVIGDIERDIRQPISVGAGRPRRRLLEADATDTVLMSLPASAAVAARFGSGDRDQGIWSAPANAPLSHVVKPAYAPVDAEGLFSDDGISVNLIRSFPARGVRIWGCRTLADGNHPTLRYLQVRRLVAYIESSLTEVARFVVFEPNNEITWMKLKGQAGAWLRDLWMKGALAGIDEKDAFRVLIGLDESMTQEDVVAGRLIMTVELAVLAPAEFIQINLQFRTVEISAPRSGASRSEGVFS